MCSGCSDLQPFADAVSSARDLAASCFNPKLMDIGGGWPGGDKGNFTFKGAAVVAEAIDKLPSCVLGRGDRCGARAFFCAREPHVRGDGDC
jgi:diaminopimelate decarboxylase